MIFVSYSHEDEVWRKRFETISKPLSRQEGMQFWSDRNIKAGEWERQIELAMKEAVAAVLFVSDNFLASDYIVEKELPYLMRAYDTRALMIVWAYLEPCDIKRYPQITRFQAMTDGDIRAMSMMNQWEWKQTMLKGCNMIDGHLKKLECPISSKAIIGKPFPKVSQVQLLAKAARRRVEVLVYSGGSKWWRQSPLRPGATTTTIHLGNDATKKGTKYNVIAMTTEKPLTERTYVNLPDYRTASDQFTLVRG